MRKFIIKSSDSYNDKNYEIVKGNMKESEDWVTYNYESRLGECEIQFSTRRVIITRKGEIPTVIDVNLDETTEFLYITKEIRKKFTVAADKIEKNEDTGVVEFSYRLYDNNMEINKITISIKNY